MTNMKRLLALSLALALCASLLSGCGGGTTSSSSGSTSASTSQDASSSASSSQEEPELMDLSGITDPYLATSGYSGDTVIAKVGDFEVTADMYLYWLFYGYGYVLQDYGLLYSDQDIPWDELDGEGVTLEQVLADNALYTASYYTLLPHLAEREGIDIDPALANDLAADYDEVKATLGSDELANYYFWANLMSPELFRELYTSGECNAQLQQKLFGEDTDGYPTDAEVLDYAENELGYYRAKHILLKTVDTSKTVQNEDGTYGYAPLDEETVNQKGDLAEELLQRINEADDPAAMFDTLMNGYSEDEGLESSPDGYTTYKGTMVAGFENGALALEEGEISGLVTSQYGYHIIMRLPLDPADYRGYLVADLMEGKSDKWLEEFGIEATEAFHNIDPSTFCAHARALQESAFVTVNEVIMAMQEEMNAAAASSQG